MKRAQIYLKKNLVAGFLKRKKKKKLIRLSKNPRGYIYIYTRIQWCNCHCWSLPQEIIRLSSLRAYLRWPWGTPKLVDPYKFQGLHEASYERTRASSLQGRDGMISPLRVLERNRCERRDTLTRDDTVRRYFVIVRWRSRVEFDPMEWHLWRFECEWTIEIRRIE